MKELWKWCLVLGSVSGCLEMGLRAESRLGLGTLELLQWLLLAVLMGCLVTFPAGLVASWMPQRRHGLVLSALLAVHAGLAYRFEVVLNLFVKDPMVWGGLLGIALGSLALGLLLDPWLRKVESKLWPLALVGALLGFIRGMPPGALSAQERPNVLIITLDTTRPDQLSVYGGEAQTPYLESLAEEGVLFEQAVATAPLTEPSHLAILSGSPRTSPASSPTGPAWGPTRSPLPPHAGRRVPDRRLHLRLPLHGNGDGRRASMSTTTISESFQACTVSH